MYINRSIHFLVSNADIIYRSKESLILNCNGNRHRSWESARILFSISFHKSIRSLRFVSFPDEFIGVCCVCMRMSWPGVNVYNVPTARCRSLAAATKQYGICQWMSHIFRAFLPRLNCFFSSSFFHFVSFVWCMALSFIAGFRYCWSTFGTHHTTIPTTNTKVHSIQ